MRPADPRSTADGDTTGDRADGAASAAAQQDWTWVLERRCPDCGLDAGTVPADELGNRVREVLPRWAPVLQRPDVAHRPAAETWSALEYACHVRDMFRVIVGRLQMVLAEEDPVFPNWDQDAAAAAGRYAEADPEQVTTELTQAGLALAAALDGVGPDERDRPGRRSDGAAFTATTLGQYALHELVHHTWDVRG
ncbi:DinB family protein [Georgenia sp. TF02-10]|uniref:DinB family protein n=1 Tax=Georgenia sp. TF02-10 TaxID=2917725 RepID=UPI001FA77FD5|nr:DinB family protein [Georgenia sp. TF02-10]UNX55655.1 DinB family protein [Georgenia sp. TF02-10]